MIRLLPRAKLTHGAHRVAPEILFAISAAETVFENYGLPVQVETILGGHTTHHQLGHEVDFRVQPEQAKDIATDLQTALLDAFVVRADGGLIHVVFTHA